MSQDKSKQNFKRAEVLELLRKKEEKMTERFRNQFGDMTADYTRVFKDFAEEERINSQSFNIFRAWHKTNFNVADNSNWLFLNFWTGFTSIDNWALNRLKKVRNWPLIIAAGLFFSSIFYFSNPQNQVAFSVWYGTGSNAYILWGVVIVAILGYLFYWRPKQTKQRQTGRQTI